MSDEIDSIREIRESDIGRIEAARDAALAEIDRLRAERDAAVASREAGLVELSGPCFCDPVASGEEFCHDTCMERQRGDAAVAREAVLLEFVDDIKDVTDIALDDSLTDRILGFFANPSPAAEELLAKAASADQPCSYREARWKERAEIAEGNLEEAQRFANAADARADRYRVALELILPLRPSDEDMARVGDETLIAFWAEVDRLFAEPAPALPAAPAVPEVEA